MSTAPIADLRAWISEAAGAAALDVLDSRWAEFLSYGQPVVTLFGAYDTGKSSILRRLVVDSGQPIPDWLTVSARHETSVSSLIEVDGCLVRDTPGLSPEGQDARSLKNSDAARASLGLTDVLLVTLNTQLPTGERPELLATLAAGWPVSCVWFLISRADEGTVDPASDQIGFQEWAERKRQELRESLALDADSPIHVVVPDYAGLGAFEPQPEPATWDISRAWDGMDTLSNALSQLSNDELTSSRAAAEQRFWSIAVGQRLTGLRAELAELTMSSDVATSSLRRATVYLKRVDALVDAARVSLGGAIDSAIRRTLNGPQIDETSIREAVDPVLSEWWHEQQAQLARIRQDAIQAFVTERSGRGWAQLESLYSTFARPDEGTSQPGLSFAPLIQSLGREAADALKAMDKVRRAQETAKRPSRAGEVLESALDLGHAADVVNAVLPFVTELASLIEGKVQSEAERTRERTRRQQVEAEVRRIVTDAADRAMLSLEPDVEALRQEISEHAIGEDAVADLQKACDLADDLVRRGSALLSFEGQKAATAASS
ncbi:GTPase domain-containing protein [Cellulomonas humilata]|uniref:GTPase domain-containing protein n=1 Tax=Cellulomonas humilata TaxID=144055 RepID=A0A7Y6DXF5_9CELL|nr:GTPase domain-containing protein [Cellulomonas humilata]NUU18471.1 GTPase domain-containing protein [Cellulomonas humilata]